MVPGLPWLSVLTCPARPQYWERTLLSIDAAGGAYFHGRRVLFVDGNIDGAIYYRGASASSWEVRGEPPQGSARAMQAILRAAFEDGAPYLLYFEDDLELAQHAVEVMARLPVPADCWALQFCDVGHVAPKTPAYFDAFYPQTSAIHRHKTDHHWGTVALKIPRWTLARVDVPVNFWHPRGHSSDVLLGKLGTTDATPYIGVVAPSIVQHIGVESICNPHRALSDHGRSAHNFPGVDFDARTLLGGE